MNYCFQELTLTLADHLRPPGGADVSYLGVDIDSKLIDRASDHAKGRNNPTFRCLDITNDSTACELEEYLKSVGRDTFDVSFCFSVSMWIHLHHGDDGFLKFIQTLSRLSRYVLLEPQPWKCYQTAARRMRKLEQDEFPLMAKLAHTQDKLEPFVLDCCERSGLKVVKQFGETDWKRKLILLKRQ